MSAEQRQTSKPGQRSWPLAPHFPWPETALLNLLLSRSPSFYIDCTLVIPISVQENKIASQHKYLGLTEGLYARNVRGGRDGGEHGICAASAIDGAVGVISNVVDYTTPNGLA